MKSLSQLMDNQNEATFFWYDEPGGEKIEIERIKDHQHMVNIKVDAFSEPYGEQIKDFETTIEFEIKEKQLIVLSYYQQKKLKACLGKNHLQLTEEASSRFEILCSLRTK